MSDIPEDEDFGDFNEEPPPFVRPPLSRKGDIVAWIFIGCVAILSYVAYLFWQKKGKHIWAKVTGAEEVDLSLYEITHETHDGKVYHLEVIDEDGVFEFVIDPPVINDFEDKYNEAEAAGHLEDENSKNEESIRVREELWTMLKNRASVTFELAQNVDSDRPEIEIAFSRNCITDAKYDSFKATRTFMQGQFKDLPDIAEILKPGSKGTFLRSVVLEIQHRNQMAQQRAVLAEIQQLKLRPDQNNVVAPPGGVPPGTSMIPFNFSVPVGKSEGDECEFRLPAGIAVSVTVPEGKKAGDVIALKVPSAFMDPNYREKQEAALKKQQEILRQSQGETGVLKFTVPPGKKAGDKCEVRLPSGMGIQVTIPPGKSPGDVLDLSVPAAALKPASGNEHGHSHGDGHGHSHGDGHGHSHGDGHGHSHGGNHHQPGMKTLPFTVPKGKKEGDVCEIRLPTGMGIKVTVPPGKKEGDVLQVQVPAAALQQPAMGQFTFKVPTGSKSGDEVTQTLPSGMQIRVKIPDGKSEGDDVSVRVPVQALQAPQMVDFPFTVPEGKSAGDETEVKLPSGRTIRVKIPEGKKPGDQMHVKVPQAVLNEPPMGEFEVIVPDGAAAGSAIEIRLPSGRPINVQVPPGKSAGDTFKIQVPKTELSAPKMVAVPFTVPEGKKAGDDAELHLPSGRTVRIKIPEGKSAGDQAHIKLPEALLQQPPLGAFNVKIPEGKSEGDAFEVRLPSGRPIRINVPPGKSAGETLTLNVPKADLSAPPMGDFPFKVPAGKKGGDEVEVTLPSGRPLKVKIPEGKTEGDDIKIQVPLPLLNEPKLARLDFKIPPGKSPGDECEIRLPSGQPIRVRVPEGKGPGDVLELRVPQTALRQGGPGPTPGPLNPGSIPPVKIGPDGMPQGIPLNAPMVKIPFSVPAGKSPGDVAEIRLPSGVPLHVTIGPGKNTGDVMQLSIPAPFMDPAFLQKQKAMMQARMAQVRVMFCGTCSLTSLRVRNAAARQYLSNSDSLCLLFLP